jgi:hypothetical protein
MKESSSSDPAIASGSSFCSGREHSSPNPSPAELDRCQSWLLELEKTCALLTVEVNYYRQRAIAQAKYTSPIPQGDSFAFEASPKTDLKPQAEYPNTPDVAPKVVPSPAKSHCVGKSPLREYFLEATACAANIFLTIDNFDIAVNTAIQVLGKSLDTDRVAVIENFHNPDDGGAMWWRLLYEWNSPYVTSQMEEPDAIQGSYAEISDWYELLQRGQSISQVLEEMPELFRSRMAKIGVKALQAVPIYVAGEWWGVVGFDDCREAKCRKNFPMHELLFSPPTTPTKIFFGDCRQAHGDICSKTQK